MPTTRLASATLVAALLGVAASPAAAHQPLLKEVKAMGLPAKTCQYCHVAKLPKKETFKPEDLNERGKWLVSQKDAQKAKDVSAEWLKEYPGGKEQ